MQKIALPKTAEISATRKNSPSYIMEFLTPKWQKEDEYCLIKELWAFEISRITVRFTYEWHDDNGQWFRSYGNENWELDENGLMQQRYASINDLAISKQERKFFWPQGPKSVAAGLRELGL